jgi:DNA-binding FadR family transcriptional regulator
MIHDMSRKAPLYQRGQEQIRQFILDQQLGAGDALPSETELAAQLGMSRLSLREAVRGLQTVGVLTVQHGGSVRVAEFSFTPILENLPYGLQAGGRSFRDLLELRESLEEGLCVRLLEVLRPRDLERLSAIARAMGDEGADLAELDRRFHEQLYLPLENPLVTQIIETFWQAFDRMGGSHTVPVPKPERLVQVHLAIVDALAGRDEKQLTQAMRDHFADIRDWAIVAYPTD